MKRNRGQEEDGPPNKKANTNAGMPRVQDALGYLEQVKQRFASQPAVYNQFLDIMKEFKGKMIDTEGVIKRVKELFEGNPSLILGFNQFLPPGYKIELEPEPPKPTIEFNHAVQYVAKIKHRFKDNPEIYGEFLDILHDYETKRTIDEVYQRVQKLFGSQPDLLDEFKYFLPDGNQHAAAQPKRSKGKNKKKGDKFKSRAKDRERELKQSRSPERKSKAAKARQVTYPAGSEKELALVDKIKAAVSRSQWTQFLKCLNLFANEVVSRGTLVRMVDDILKDKSDFAERFRNAIGYDDCAERELQLHDRNNYYAFVSSVDFTTCKEVTASYRQLPDEISIPPCSGRTTLSDMVLNDKCISMATGSEDFSFKATRKNIYEENLFKCEDERFELDMCIENNLAAIRVLEPIVQQVSQLSAEQAKRLRLNKNVDILHIRAIARLYGEQGHEVVQLLKRHPSMAAPVILGRMRAKDEEWRRVRHSMKNTWRKVAEQNYQRSLDHRSFYFKQEDKKRRSPKALLAELRTVHNRLFGPKDVECDEGLDSEPETEFLRHLARDHEPLYTYCMRFKCDDVEIHHQIWHILWKVAKDLLPPPAQEKFRVFWLGFLHHFFGVPEPVESPKTATQASAPKPEVKAPEPAPPTQRHRRRAKDRKGAKQAAQLDLEGESHSTPVPEEEEEVLDGMEAVREKKKRKKRRSRKKGNEGNMDSESDSDSDDGPPPEVPSPLPIGFADEQVAAISVKPLRVMLDTWELQETLFPMRRHTRPSRLFFGNNMYSVFFRLHQFLYNRLSKAKALARKARRPTAASKKKKFPATPKLRLERFLEMLNEVLNGRMEANRYEDECRLLLGAASFALFTLGSLIRQLVKQTEALLRNHTCMQLLQLYKYELARAKRGVRSEAHSAELALMYQSNCAAITGDDYCCQVEFFEDTQELGIGVLDTFAQQSSKKPASGWSEYKRQFMDHQPVSGQSTSPFLVRNLRRYLPARAPAGENETQRPKTRKPAKPKKKRGRAKKIDKKQADSKMEQSEQTPETDMGKAPEAEQSVQDAKLASRLESVWNCVTEERGLEASVCALSFRMYYQDGTSDRFVRHTARRRWQAALRQASDATSTNSTKSTKTKPGRHSKAKKAKQQDDEKAILLRAETIFNQQREARFQARKARCASKAATMQAWALDRLRALAAQAEAEAAEAVVEAGSTEQPKKEGHSEVDAAKLLGALIKGADAGSGSVQATDTAMLGGDADNLMQLVKAQRHDDGGKDILGTEQNKDDKDGVEDVTMASGV